MHTHFKNTTLLRASVVGVALAAAPALAQPASASTAGASAPTQLQPDNTGAVPDGQTTAEATENQVSTPAVSPGARAIARWVRAIGGRISIGPKVDHRTTVSHPDLAITNLNRRIWVPSFSHARLVGPPARALRATAIAPAADSATGDPAQAEAGEVTADAPFE